MNVSTLVPVLIIVFFLAAALIGGMFFMIKKIDPQGADKTEDPNLKIAQDFLPFDDIRDNTILLGRNRYRARLLSSGF